ncbi:MAG: hypothetical protein GX465_06005 [Acidobacteria bacterium]|nr:hypothetical protein [Acidobacteriota bacterium]
MYDETIQRAARKAEVKPILFEHPTLSSVRGVLIKPSSDPMSVILTGTAGDGKTHLCRNIWTLLEGPEEIWQSDDPHISLTAQYPKNRKAWPDSKDLGLYREVTIHVIRDLSAWAPQQGLRWPDQKVELLDLCSRSFFDAEAKDIFLIAANDGQLIECWRRLPSKRPETDRARQLIEDLLVGDLQQRQDTRLKLFNISRWRSTDLFDRALKGFLEHPGWRACYDEAEDNGFFGPRCPIRHNYELLGEPVVQKRLRNLIELCDHNGLHIAIRQLLLLLANAVLGHSDAKDQLLRAKDVKRVIKDESVSKASLFNNIFGGNLPETRRNSITVFDYLDRLQIGFETCNRIDNILMFGEGDNQLKRYFDAYIGSDNFYGADARYQKAKRQYVEGFEEGDSETSQEFLDMLVAQRRGLFFKISPDQENELRLWSLTVFQFAGEYLKDIVGPLSTMQSVRGAFLSRLVKGLNRIFSGMLINSEHELFLVTSASYSQAKVSKLLEYRLPLNLCRGERIYLSLESGRVRINFQFSHESTIGFPLSLVRYEFISRVATEGALPASFSKECYEDILSLKSQLLSEAESRTEPGGGRQHLSILNIAEDGTPVEQYVEVLT